MTEAEHHDDHGRDSGQRRAHRPAQRMFGDARCGPREKAVGSRISVFGAWAILREHRIVATGGMPLRPSPTPPRWHAMTLRRPGRKVEDAVPSRHARMTSQTTRRRHRQTATVGAAPASAAPQPDNRDSR